ncbi:MULTISPECIES: phage tail protein [Kosakonia]|jgi:phage protein U|uniref:Phage tail protein n=1 Tax=Kosakonia cowanii JCM 10956 = DSM 18146 TaxID=1300165 RepID=A0A807LAU3_9ENTR|nr:MULTISPECIES: phage tail protein [Kosakonia]APZ04367.1 phage tail protein [Kosakonia cowanii] [Kosakonia cowanii JCM 10956 = DSM 18146]MDY0889957.1 phage tail protein [Kosakonia sp. CFBP8986]QAR45189.1 phage tail protein [Kosakonia cowanii]WPG19946.1 phage tail protein [Kosakonia cowanii]WRY58640.1 phage tail protein [Kosakonia cowanii]
MMLALGLFVFMRQTLPYQTMQRDSTFRWPSNARMGKRNAFQYTGPENDTITISGELFPEITGGTLSLSAVRLMAEQGKAWPLIDGTGMIYGMFVINSVSETGTLFYPDGSPRKINFTLKLTRVDESLKAMFGDIYDQGKQLATNMLERF